MKKTGVVVLILVLAVLALPGLFGMFTARQVDARVGELNDTGTLQVTVTDYRRGWFASDVRLRIAAPATPMQPPSAADPAMLALAYLHMLLDEPLAVTVRIAHGPLAFSRGPHLGTSAIHATSDADDPRVASRTAALGVPYLFDFHARAGFGGAIDFEAVIPPLDTDVSLVQIRFSGATLDGRLDGARLSSRLALDSLILDAALVRMDVDGLRFEGDNTLMSRHVILGPAELLLSGVSVSGPLLGPAPMLDGRLLRFSGTNTLDRTSQTLSSEARLAFDSFAWRDEMLLRSAELRLQVDNLDLDAWQRLATTAEQMATGVLPEAAAITRIEPLVRELLSGGPSVAIDPLTVEVDGETMTARARIAVDGSRVADRRLTDPGDVTMLLGMLDASAEASLPKSLVESVAADVSRTQIRAAQSAGRPIREDEIDAMAEAQANLILLVLASQGLIEEDGNNYRAELLIRDGAVTINGSALPFALP